MSRKGKERQRDDDNSDKKDNHNDNSEEKTNLDENGNHIPRPPNMFILFRKIWCKDPEMKRKYPDNKQMSKVLGEKWRALSPEERKWYKDEAARLKKEHKEKYPNWVFKPTKPVNGKKRKNSEDDDEVEEIESPAASSIEQPKPKRVMKEQSTSSVGPLQDYESVMDIPAMPQPSTSRLPQPNAVLPTELRRALQSVASGITRSVHPQPRDGIAGEINVQRIALPFTDSSLTTPGTANARSPVDGSQVTPWNNGISDMNGPHGQPSSGMPQNQQQSQVDYTNQDGVRDVVAGNSIYNGYNYLPQGSSVNNQYNPAIDWSQAPVSFPFPNNYHYPFSFAQDLPAQNVRNSYHRNSVNANIDANGQIHDNASSQVHEGYYPSQLTSNGSQQYQDQPDFSQGPYSGYLTLDPSLYYTTESQLQSDFGPFVPDDVPASLVVAASEGHATSIEAVQDLGFDTSGLFASQQELDVSSGWGWNDMSAYYKNGDGDDELQTPGAGPSGSGGASY
ncbi:hypothetical protein PM082_021845 [Marasmius tenuissimus]|nr:hypothetical protein PM082_021845 [Marasmius tenuissimus]